MAYEHTTYCPLCGETADPRLLAYAQNLRKPIVHLIKQQHSSWRPAQGICPACALRFAELLASQRQPTSLHTSTDPHGTFPYYHAREETVLSQPERLPDYEGMDGTGVTIAFLDSGYFPHPDFSRSMTWVPGAAWEMLRWRQWQSMLRMHETRMVEYVDLADDRHDVGLGIASLWDSAVDSWHGEMTSAIAAGNGMLSQGHYRGYAPGANLLPMKVGRSSGRIPEADILAGMQWLLQDDRWADYGVRVLNVSVGGDFVQPWHENPVCQAVEELVHRGVFVAAAAGNRNQRRLLAPAQSPSVMTVGGADDANRRWRPDRQDDVKRLELYAHNYGHDVVDGERVRKPELLGLGQWLPAPVLPVSPVFREMVAIDKLRQTLIVGDRADVERLLEHSVRTLYIDPVYAGQHHGRDGDAWLDQIWQALRKRMNAHKWVHAHYQHVDGTSVAVAQVSAVAAQMAQANPSLSPDGIRNILQATALPLLHLPAAKRGHGLIVPASAVAAALRAPGGQLAGLPQSGTVFTDEHTLHNLLADVPRVDARALVNEAHTWVTRPAGSVGSGLHPGENGGKVASSASFTGEPNTRPVYLGLLAPQVHRVSVMGSFNRWRPQSLWLQPAGNGWWHVLLLLPPGTHVYRFWVQDERHPEGNWRLDPENPLRVESGYRGMHSLINTNSSKDQ